MPRFWNMAVSAHSSSLNGSKKEPWHDAYNGPSKVTWLTDVKPFMNSLSWCVSPGVVFWILIFMFFSSLLHGIPVWVVLHRLLLYVFMLPGSWCWSGIRTSIRKAPHFAAGGKVSFQTTNPRSKILPKGGFHRYFKRMTTPGKNTTCCKKRVFPVCSFPLYVDLCFHLPVKAKRKHRRRRCEAAKRPKRRSEASTTPMPLVVRGEGGRTTGGFKRFQPVFFGFLWGSGGGVKKRKV